MHRQAYIASLLSAGSLLVLCLLWETVLAPLRPGGSWLLLKALPLLPALNGMLRERVYTFRWTTLLTMFYLCEGLVRVTTDQGLGRALAGLETVLALVLFAAASVYVRTSTSGTKAAER